MGYITPALGRFLVDLCFQFHDVRVGLYNRRRISGSLSWSQHSWPNAIDIYFTTPAGDTSAAHQLRLAAVAHWIRTEYPEYGEIRNTLWLVKNHYDHIHVDFWPKGYRTPSTLRGGLDNRYKTRDGRVITQSQLTQEGVDDLALLTDDEQRQLKEFLAHIKAKDSSVGFVKHAIQMIRDHRPGGPLAPREPLDLDDYEITIQRKEV